MLRSSPSSDARRSKHNDVTSSSTRLRHDEAKTPGHMSGRALSPTQVTNNLSGAAVSCRDGRR
jgi:hypothetical protein